MIRRTIGFIMLLILVYLLYPKKELVIQDLWVPKDAGFLIEGVEYDKLSFFEGDYFTFYSGYYKSLRGTYVLGKDELTLYVNQINNAEAYRTYVFSYDLSIKNLSLSSTVDHAAFKPFEVDLKNANTVGANRLDPSF